MNNDDPFAAVLDQPVSIDVGDDPFAAVVNQKSTIADDPFREVVRPKDTKEKLKAEQAKIAAEGDTGFAGGFGAEIGERLGEFGKGVAGIVPAAMKAVAALQHSMDQGYEEGDIPPEARPTFKAATAVEKFEEKILPSPTNPDIWHGVAQGGGQVAQMLAGGAAAKAAGAGMAGMTALASTMGGIQEFGDAYEMSRNRGDDPDTALAKSLGYATVAGLIENKLGAGRLLRRYFPTAKEAVQKLTALGVSKTLLGNFIAGGLEEGSQRWAENLIVEGRPSMEGVLEEAGPGAIVEGIAGIPHVATTLRESGAPLTAAAVEQINLPILTAEQTGEIAPQLVAVSKADAAADNFAAAGTEQGILEAVEPDIGFDIRKMVKSNRAVELLTEAESTAGLNEILPTDERTDIRKQPVEIGGSDAIQKQSANAEVLGNEVQGAEPQLGLRPLGEGNQESQAAAGTSQETLIKKGGDQVETQKEKGRQENVLAPTAGETKAERFQIGQGPQTFTLIEKLPQTEIEKTNGEQPVRVKNERTGKEEIVLESELRQVKESTGEKPKRTTKADLNVALKNAGLDPSAFPDQKSKKSALERAAAKVEEAQKKLRGSRATVSMGVPKAILDLALESIRLALRAGATVQAAIEKGIAAAMEKFSETNEDDLRAAIVESIASERKESQGFLTGQYASNPELRQAQEAEAFAQGKTDDQILSEVQGFSGGQSIPGLSDMNVPLVVANLTTSLFDKLTKTTDPVEVADLNAKIAKAASLLQQRDSVAGQGLQAVKLAKARIGFMAPYLAFRGLAQKMWARALGVPETVDMEGETVNVVKDSGKKAAKETEENIEDKDEENQSENSAQKIIDELAKSQSDTLSWPQKIIDGVRETVKWFILGDITEDELVATMDNLKIEPNTTRVLLGVAKREYDIHQLWLRKQSEERQARKINQAEQRKIQAQAMIALKIGLEPIQQADALLKRYAQSQSDTFSWTEKKRSQVKEAFAGLLSGDITEAEFRASMDTIGIVGATTQALIGVAKRELATREYYKQIKKQEALTKKINSGMNSELLKAIRESGIKLSTLFLDKDHASQAERRKHLFDQIRKQFPNLTQEQKLALEKALSEAWENARLKIWRGQFKKIVGLPEVATENILDAVQPELIRQANLGTLTDEAFRSAIARKLGLPDIDGNTAQEMIKLSQEAQAAPEGLLRNKILQKMIDKIQSSGDFSSWDLLRDYWYASTLSGLRTATAVLLGSWLTGAAMTTGMAFDLAITKASPAVASKLIAAYVMDTIEGFANGYDVFKTGDYTRRAEFADNINAVLSGKGKLDSLEGFLRHGNAKWKKALGVQAYVRRAIVGLDYVGAIATRGSGIIYNAALKGGDQLEIANRRFNKKLSQQAKTQAKVELGPGSKWVDVKARQLEILEEGLSHEIQQQAKVLGELAALNAQPVGWSGIAYGALEGLAQVIGKKAGVSRESASFGAFAFRTAVGLAFFRAALNQVGNASNWVPGIGGIQWFRSYLGTKTPEWSKNNPLRHLAILDENGQPITEDRRRLILAAQAMSISASIALYALAHAAADDDDKDGFDVSGSWRGYTPQEKKRKQEAGEIPYGFTLHKKTGRWFSWKDMGFGGAFVIPGELRDKERRTGKPTEFDDASKAFSTMTDAAAMGSLYVKDLSMLSGLFQALGVSAFNTEEAATGANRMAAQLTRPVSGMIPFSSLLREIDTWGDNQVYRPSSGADYWIMAIPFVRRYVGEGPEYNMAGLPVRKTLTPASRFVAEEANDPLVKALASLVNRGIMPHFPYNAGWIKDGERKSSKDFAERDYQYKVQAVKAWREIMLPDAAEISKMTDKEYQEYYQKNLAPIAQEIHDDFQNEIDPDVLRRRRGAKHGQRKYEKNPRYEMKGKE